MLKDAFFFVLGMGAMGAVWGYRGWLGRKAAALQEQAKDAAVSAVNAAAQKASDTISKL